MPRLLGDLDPARPGVVAAGRHAAKAASPGLGPPGPDCVLGKLFARAEPRRLHLQMAEEIPDLS